MLENICSFNFFYNIIILPSFIVITSEVKHVIWWISLYIYFSFIKRTSQHGNRKYSRIYLTNAGLLFFLLSKFENLCNEKYFFYKYLISHFMIYVPLRYPSKGSNNFKFNYEAITDLAHCYHQMHACILISAIKKKKIKNTFELLHLEISNLNTQFYC